MAMEPKLIVSDIDYEKILSLIANRPSELMVALEDELGKARIVTADEVPPNVVTLNSVVRVKDLDKDTESEIKLVLPNDADIEAKKVSILAPMGMALIGLQVGQKYQWLMPSGKIKRFQIMEILSQGT